MGFRRSWPVDRASDRDEGRTERLSHRTAVEVGAGGDPDTHVFATLYAKSHAPDRQMTRTPAR